MKALEMRGAAFRRRREARNLSLDDVAKMLRVPRKSIVAFEAGVIMQSSPGAEKKIASLNAKWTAEELNP